MYRAAARRVCRCHGMDRDEAQQPPPTCWLPHLATATGVGWLRSFWFSIPPARAPGVRAAPRSSAMRTLVSRIAFHMKRARRLDLLADVGRYRCRCCRSGRNVCANRNWGWSARCPLNVGPTHFTVALPVLYRDRRGRPKVRIHGRPRSGRKRSFLLSAVAPSTSTRQPREARPINWAQRGGLAGNALLTPRPHFTAHHARLVTRWFVLRTALLFVRSAVRLVYAELPGAGSGLLAEKHQHVLVLTHARVVITDWKHEYNHHRRHSAPDQTPATYAAACTHR
jgi:hypothetical protein